MGICTWYKCNDCGKTTVVNLGFGFMYPIVKEEELNKAKSGVHGREIQDICNKDSEAFVDVCNKLYVCEKCGYWNCEMSLDLIKGEFLEEPQVLLKRVHRCPKCDGFMVEKHGEIYEDGDEDDPEMNYCPECGSKNIEIDYGFWD